MKGGDVEKKKASDYGGRGMQLGKYELGKTLGEGNFGKVKFAKDVDSGQSFAVKILEKKRITNLNIAEQVLVLPYFFFQSI
jgi:5'-AMP-activated protein kinase catalytic alpha subunit